MIWLAGRLMNAVWADDQPPRDKTAGRNALLPVIKVGGIQMTP